jgi:hypothetical protein
VKELQAVCARMRERWDVRKVAIAHRTGVVPVGEASVIVAVSSAHRREALEATQFGIDELKARFWVAPRQGLTPELTMHAHCACRQPCPSGRRRCMTTAAHGKATPRRSSVRHEPRCNDSSENVKHGCVHGDTLVRVASEHNRNDSHWKNVRAPDSV